jgi:hypothetical protein
MSQNINFLATSPVAFLLLARILFPGCVVIAGGGFWIIGTWIVFDWLFLLLCLFLSCRLACGSLRLVLGFLLGLGYWDIMVIFFGAV